MNKQSKFIKTAIAAAALGLMAVGAQAAAVQATPVKYAVELFGGTTPATAITGGNIQIVAASAIPANSTITVMLKLTNAKFAANATAADAGTTVANTVVSPAVTTAAAGAGTLAVSYGSTNAGATAATTGIAAATATTNNADVLVIQLGTTDNAIGIGGTIATVYAPQLSAAALATVGTEVSATAYVFVGTVGAQFGQQPTGTNLEATSTAVKVADSARAVTMTMAAAATTQQIDASGNGSKKFTTAGAAAAADSGSNVLVQLGKLNIVETAGVKAADGATDYTVAAKAGADNTKTTVTVTAPAGYFSAAGDTGSLTVRAYNVNACAGAALATYNFATDAAAAAAATATIPLALIPAHPTQAAHVCMTVEGDKVIKDGAAAASAVLGATTAQAQDSSDSAASASLNSLTLNGASVEVNSYWPAVLSTAGYGVFTRITNTGSVGAAVSVDYINPTTGAVAGNPVVIPLAGFAGNVLPAGATVTLANSVIENAVGSAHPAGYKSGRIKLTAPTGSLRIQSFIQGANTADRKSVV